MKKLTNKRPLDEKMQTLAFRYLCLGVDYRKQMNFTFDSLLQAKTSLERLLDFVEKGKPEGSIEKYEKEFIEAINDDMNTAKALGILWKMVRDKNYPINQRIGSLLKMDSVLGLGLQEQKTPKGFAQAFFKANL